MYKAITSDGCLKRTAEAASTSTIPIPWDQSDCFHRQSVLVTESNLIHLVISQ